MNSAEWSWLSCAMALASSGAIVLESMSRDPGCTPLYIGREGGREGEREEGRERGKKGGREGGRERGGKLRLPNPSLCTL